MGGGGVIDESGTWKKKGLNIYMNFTLQQPVNSEAVNVLGSVEAAEVGSQFTGKLNGEAGGSSRQRCLQVKRDGLPFQICCPAVDLLRISRSGRGDVWLAIDREVE